MKWIKLNEPRQLDEIREQSTKKTILIFKHSTRCGISRMSLKQFENEYDLGDLIVPYFVDLLEDRALSDAIAKRFGVAHESPQLILIRNGQTVFDASHGDIYADDLKRYI